MKIEIREILMKDNDRVKEILVNVMKEFGVPDHGTALQDDELNSMYESYQVNSSKYYVVISDGDIKGGAGISKLKGSNENICELQKMYFLQDIRGKGIGSKLIKMCLDFAKKSGYQFCYIETMHNMIAAQKLYKKNGFFLLDSPLGNTGHNSCPVWMKLKL